MPLVKASDLAALERRVAALEAANKKPEPKKTAPVRTAPAATQKKEAD